MHSDTGPILTLTLQSDRLTQNFLFLQSKLTQYDRRLLNLQSELSTLTSSTTQSLSGLTSKLQQIQPKLFKSTQHKVTNSISFYVADKVKEFYQANQKNAQSGAQVERQMMRRIGEMKAALKAEITHESQEVIKAEMREVRRRDKKKEKEEKEKRLYHGQGSGQGQTAGQVMDAELGDKIDQFFMTVDEINAQAKRNRQVLNSLELKTYDSTTQLNIQVDQLAEQIREYKKFVVDSNESVKMQLVKLKTAAMIPLQGGKQQMSDETIMSSFAEIRENLAKSLTKTEFQSLYSKNVWNQIDLMKDEMDSIKKEVASNQEKNKYIGHITEGIEKYQEFINDSFEKVYQKQENVRQAFAMKLEQFSKVLYSLRQAQSGLQKQQYTFGQQTKQQFQKFEQRWTNLQYQQSCHSQQIVILHRNLAQAKKDIDNSNYSMKHMADEFDRKVAQTVSDLKQGMGHLKTDFDNLYAAQAKKSQINELWKAVNVLQTKLGMYKVEADQVFHMNKKSWMLAESQILKGRGSLQKLSNTVFNRRTQIPLKTGDMAVKTTRFGYRQDSI